jgi:hypothetical protein
MSHSADWQLHPPKTPLSNLHALGGEAVSVSAAIALKQSVAFWDGWRPAPLRARIIGSGRYDVSMRLAGKRRIFANPLVVAVLAGMLVWLADQPTIPGYNPLLAMFWDPGVGNLPLRDCLVLLLSWLVTTLFCHFVLFSVQKVRRRSRP